MACYERTADNQFLYYQKNQGSIDMFYLQNNTRWDLIAEKLVVSGYAGIYRYFNREKAIITILRPTTWAAAWRLTSDDGR